MENYIRTTLENAIKVIEFTLDGDEIEPGEMIIVNNAARIALGADCQCDSYNGFDCGCSSRIWNAKEVLGLNEHA